MHNAVRQHKTDAMGQTHRKSEAPLFDIEHLKQSTYTAVPKNDTYSEIKSKNLKKKVKANKARMVEKDVLLNGEKHTTTKTKDAGVENKNGGFERGIKKRAEELKVLNGVNGSITEMRGHARDANGNTHLRGVNGGVNGGFRGVNGVTNHRKTQSLFIEVGNGQRNYKVSGFSLYNEWISI